MLEDFRRQLTSWFVVLFLLLYCLGGAVAAFVFNSVLTSQLDDELQGLHSEIGPLIYQSPQKPSLKLWYDNVLKHHQRLYSTIQIFDANGILLEEYGPPGVPELAAGTLPLSTGDGSVRSSYKPIDNDNKVGYVQVQTSTKHSDNAVYQLIIILCLLAPFFALAVWIAGYFFSGRATKPVVETMALLRRFCGRRWS